MLTFTKFMQSEAKKEVMKNLLKKAIAFFFVFSLLQVPVKAYWVWSPEQGKFVNPDGVSQDSAEEQYDYAMQFYKEKNIDEALKQLENLIKKYPAARIASEAQYRRATIYEEKGDFWKAYHVYKDLVESYPHSDRIEEVMEREFRIGNLFLSGKKARWMGLEILPSLPKSVQVFQHIVQTSPYGPYGHEAQFRLGLAYKKSGQFAKAMEAFQYLIEQYPQSEFVPEARYQLAETSFLNSTAAYRDERALEQASTAVGHFLTRSPDEAGAEKAAKLQQMIDEKNAEKSFQIGHYYEKGRYLDSAMIYYQDVAKRYPETKWGAKATQRMQALKQPVSYLKGQSAEIEKALSEARVRQTRLGGKDSIERDVLKREIERLEQRRKSIEQNKAESISARREDLKRREEELREKQKKLAEKQKLLQKNPSEDLKKALDRWLVSLDEEKSRLADERSQLQAWQSDLGIRERGLTLDFLPFIGEGPTELEKVRRVGAKKYYDISGEKKELLSEKELLYKHHGEVVTFLRSHGIKPAAATILPPLTGTASATKLGDLTGAEKELRGLEKEYAAKKEAYEKKYSRKTLLEWAVEPAQLVSRSLDKINPFGGATGVELESKTLEELLERRMHLRERLASEQAVVDTLSQAFNTELAVQEQKRIMAQLESHQKGDGMELRHQIKGLEKSIRADYREIEDGHQRKKALLKQLESTLGADRDAQGAAAKTVRVASSPVTGVYHFSRAFLFGRKPRDLKLTQNADKISPAADESAVHELKQKIELESLLIEGRYDQALKKQRQLEALKAQASLAGGYKFRSAMVKVPYGFIREALESADRLVPKKDRQETLIHLMDKETRELESLKAELKALEALIEKKTPAKARGKAAAAPGDRKNQAAVTAKELPGEESQLRGEIQALAGKISEKQANLVRRTGPDAVPEEEAEELPAAAELKKARLEKPVSPKDVKKLKKELGEVEKDISKLITKESRLDHEETTILEKRITMIDQFIQKTRSKAGAQDLLAERSRIETRLNELKLRRDFLTQELGRFHPTETARQVS